MGVGLISYSAYLWHQPLFAFARIRILTGPPQWLMVALGLLALLLARISWRYIEQPFRNRTSPFPSTRVRLFGMSAAVGSLFVAMGLSGYFGQGFGWRSNGEVTFEGLQDRIIVNHGLSIDCEGAFTNSPNCATSDHPRFLLWGDSFAMHLAQGIVASDPEIAMQQHTISSCSPILGISQIGGEKTASWARGCIAFNQHVLDWIRTHDEVDVVVMSSPFQGVLSGNILLENDEVIQGEAMSFVAQALIDTATALRDMGKRVVLVSPTPRSGWDNGRCAVLGAYLGAPESTCDFALDTDTRPYELLRMVEDQVPVYWLYKDSCFEGICHEILNGTFIFRDAGHLSMEGSAYLGRTFDWAARLDAVAN